MYDIRSMNIWKQEEKAQPNLKGMRDLDISEMNLSVRSYNCLKRANCNTIGDVLDLMDEDGNGLRRIRNLGSRSEAEIKELLENLRKEYAARPVPAETTVKKLLRPARKAMDRTVDSYRLSGAARSRLRESGICFVRDLYADNLIKEPGWFAVRELFEQILRQ